MDAIANVIIGTAGHIDHGKTRLVEALTGTNADRWDEERSRGITIDIGFASRELPDGRRVGFIDVPGHERFVRHMIAGAAGVDVVLLVVAADDGVMPQTREHLDIVGLLGVRDGVVAVTKADIDPELAGMAAEEARELVRGTFLEGAPVIPVSSVTGEGLDELWRALVERIGRAKPRPAGGLFRMPVQRVFTRQGFGTIVTGVPVSGTARAADAVEILPGGGRGRVRGVQAYFADVEVARAGHSTGLNVADVDPGDVRRGQVVVPPGTYEPTTLVEARLFVLPSARKPLATGAAVKFHTGTAEVTARVVVLDRAEVRAGEEALVQLRLAEPVVVGRLDRFVVRRPTPAVTIGGGTVIGPGERRLRANRPWVAEALRAREAASRSDDTFVEHLVESAAGGSVHAEVLRARALLPAERTGEIVAALAASGRVLTFPPGPSCAHARTLLRLAQRLRDSLAELHAREPHLPGIEFKRAARELGVPVPLLELVCDRAEYLSRDGDYVRLRSHAPSLNRKDEEVARKVEAIVRDAGFSPPGLQSGPGGAGRKRPGADDLPGLSGAREDRLERVLAFLVHAGTLVAVAPGMFFHGEAVERARAFVLGELEAKGHLETQAFKGFMGASRKYLVPMLEHFDRAGLTRREGDRRVAGEKAGRASSPHRRGPGRRYLTSGRGKDEPRA